MEQDEIYKGIMGLSYLASKNEGWYSTLELNRAGIVVPEYLVESRLLETNTHGILPDFKLTKSGRHMAKKFAETLEDFVEPDY